MTSPTRIPLLAAAFALLALAAGARAAEPAIEPIRGACQLKLRTGRIMEAQGLEAVEGTPGFYRILLGGSSTLVVPVREIKSATVLARDPAPGIVPLAAEEPQLDASFEPSSCDPLDDPRIRQWDGILEAASAKHGLDVDLVRAVVAVESCGNSKAVSRKGAVGLMQLLPSTAKDYGCTDPTDPSSNVDAGCTHLARLKKSFGDELSLVLAAYNAGESAVRKAKGIPRFKETQGYVRDVLAHRARLMQKDES